MTSTRDQPGRQEHLRDNKTLIPQIRELIRNARSVAVLTGAGISAESGVPTFRGAGGLWRQYRAEDLATAAAFRRDPTLVWEWYQWRRDLIAATLPNPGHLAIAELEHRTGEFALITQNVDGLHDRAGSRNILKIHGDIWINRCMDCRFETREEGSGNPSRCTCGGSFRPGVVWFGEPLPPDVWDAAERASRRAGVFIVAGTSAQVYPAAGLVPLARSCGATVIEVNLEETPISSLVDFSLRGRCGEVLPELVG